MLKYGLLICAALGTTTVEASAQGVLTAGVYSRSIDDGTARLTVADVPTGNSVVVFVMGPFTVSAACKGHMAVTVNFDLPKSYAMGTPVPGNGTCTVLDATPGCNITCSVPTQNDGFNQSSPVTIVATNASGSYTYTRSRSDKPAINFEVKDIMNVPPARKK